jgi:threonine synthase
MKFYDINNPSNKVTLEEAVIKSISGTSGLYMPESIPLMPESFYNSLAGLGLQEIALQVSVAMFGNDIPENDLQQIINEALSFPIPLKQLDDNIFVLELFHGPTLAFKDVGARFMAGFFQYFLRNQDKEVVILVATSGDTGSAVANAFYNKKGVRVMILYPSGKVSGLQEKQLTTMGGNITALEVEGDFDDCQRLVKLAFADKEVNNRINLTSANSINFARLFPQSFFYFHALAQLGRTLNPVVISVPSGNLGNLTSGLIAKKMGLPVRHFIAATNRNRVVPNYLSSGEFKPQQTFHTISNAMDVGNPSNFPRLLEIYDRLYTVITSQIKGFSFDDEQNRHAMAELQKLYSYQADPHGAIGYLGLREYGLAKDTLGIFLETAHPAKFPFEVEKATQIQVAIPEALKGLANLPSHSIKISNTYSNFSALLETLF